MACRIEWIPEQVVLGAPPPTPGAGSVKLYRRADGNWYELDENGVETQVNGGGAGNNFGDDYQFEERNGRATTSSGSYQTRVTLTTPALTGTYHVQWTCILDSDGVADVRIREDNSTISDMEFKPTDDSEDDRCFSGFDRVVFTGSSKTFRLQWRGNGDTSGIAHSRIALWRIL